MTGPWPSNLFRGAVIAGATAVAGCSSITYGTGTSTTTQTVADIVNIVDIVPSAKEPIDYRPRGNLVTPATADLPPPAPAPTVANNAPQDANRAGQPVVNPFGGGGNRGGSLDPTGQPVRRYLTEPPVDYRQPSPDAPVAIAERPPQQRRFSLRSLWPF